MAKYFWQTDARQGCLANSDNAAHVVIAEAQTETTNEKIFLAACGAISFPETTNNGTLTELPKQRHNCLKCAEAMIKLDYAIDGSNYVSVKVSLDQIDQRFLKDHLRKCTDPRAVPVPEDQAVSHTY